MGKILEGNGLKASLVRTKTWVAAQITALADVYALIAHTHKKADITDLAEATTAANGLMSANDKTKLDGIAGGAQVNAIEAININGNALTPVGKVISFTVPTKVSDISNDKQFQTKGEVDAAIGTALSAAVKYERSVETSELTGDLLIADNKNKMFNVKGQFTTDANFLEGDGKTYPAGTNIVVVEESDGIFKFDVQGSSYDLSQLVVEELTVEEVEAICNEVFGV